ncbi:hypothetical protein Glove_86g39 [Diversispora epigaea]|uniref:Uncharacterized protein n=1 Tax=Diversispora epigaea TaxID=1348612 RepID=A0A397JGD7_9GLOM|nr:hypothetical protein Glove_86g39 [Diversispora epigaea]
MSKQSSLAIDDTHSNSDTYHPLPSPVIFIFLVPPQYDNEYYLYLNGKNQDSEIGIQIKKVEKFLANQESTNTTTTTTTPLNYQTHPQAIYTSRLLNYSKLPKPKNEENFKRELEELTKSFSHITTSKY